MTNLILNTDSYKASHWLQYPPKTENVSSYIEPRISKSGRYKTVIPFGLQIALKRYLTKPITFEDVREAKRFWLEHGEPFNEEGWMHILDNHDGFMPVVIKAVLEGTPVPVGSPIVTVEATDERCFWLVSYLETMLLRAVWYGTTVATQSWHLKQLIKSYLEKTGDPTGLVFKLHDFGARGVSSMESAGIGGAAHLVNFSGTDTVSGVLCAQKYYGPCGMPGFSIPGAEHSTVTAWGPFNEKEAYENMIKAYGKKNAVYAVVSDSYDIYNAVSKIWGEALRQQVIDSGATLVVRPDSGHPATVVTTVLRLLDEKFGSKVNEKGYKVLNNVRVIQGDGINPDSIKEILEWVTSAGYSADNVAFGMGGQLLQGVNRDTLSFAMKASAIKIDGKWLEVSKNPVSDPEKRSKRGRQTLMKSDDNIFPVSITPEGYVPSDGKMKEIMVPVFRDGELLVDQKFDEVRARASDV